MIKNNNKNKTERAWRHFRDTYPNVPKLSPSHLLSCFTASSKLSTKYLTSSIVFSLPKVILKLPFAKFAGIPVARSTCDGFISPALQADPT